MEGTSSSPSSSPSAPMSSDALDAAATMSLASVPSFPPAPNEVVASSWPLRHRARLSLPPFAAASLGSETALSPAQGKHNFDIALSADYVGKTLAGTSVYTVSNSFRSLGIFCFRKEDGQTLLAQVKLRQPILGRGAKVVPIVLDQLWSADISQGLDGVPVFQVGSFEDVLKKMEMNDKNSGRDDLLFIPPGKATHNTSTRW